MWDNIVELSSDEDFGIECEVSVEGINFSSYLKFPRPHRRY